MRKGGDSIMPVLKWVGGKRQLLASIVGQLPENIKDYRYIEPFVGGGAVFFHLQPDRAIINDSNTELINVYEVIKNHPDELLEDLKKHKNEAGYFYHIRGLDRTDEFSRLTPVQRASRIIYLNKTCYNGLYRVNSAGEFNVPFGKYKKPNFVNELRIRAVSRYLNQKDISIINTDFAWVLEMANEKSFVYIDPPYHPLSESSNFTGYVQGGWDKNEQVRLKEACDVLDSKGIKFLLSNSSAPFILDLYSHYNLVTVRATRAVNSNATDRGEIDEVLVKNYD